MKVNSLVINITSEKPERLLTFYREVVGLPPHPDSNRESTLIAGGAELVFDSHSETKGPAKEPQRVLINFFVDDLAAEQSRLEEQGVKFIRTAGKEYWGGVISTFLDPDGNYCQLIEYKPQ
jgi:predicted enzyme related to lactoylglutathione lyase